MRNMPRAIKRLRNDQQDPSSRFSFNSLCQRDDTDGVLKMKSYSGPRMDWGEADRVKLLGVEIGDRLFPNCQIFTVATLQTDTVAILPEQSAGEDIASHELDL